MYPLRARAVALIVAPVGLIALSPLPAGCGGLAAVSGGLFDLLDHAGGISSSTIFTSSSLAGGSNPSGQSAPAVVDTPEGLRITPTNITGKVLTLLFPIESQEDEGVVVFGNNRPDIAPASSELLDFDMAQRLAVNGTVQLKPGYVGGQSGALNLLFGYIDVEFVLNGRARVVRVALADVNGMQRGDLLLWFDGADATAQTMATGSAGDATTGDGATTTGRFRWYDLDADQFVSTRPDNPVVIEAIRDFFDPVRPHLVFYPLRAELTSTLDLRAEVFENAISMNVVLDFILHQAVVLEGQHDETIDDAALIQSFNLANSAFGFGQSGLQVNADVTFDRTATPTAGTADTNPPSGPSATGTEASGSLGSISSVNSLPSPGP